MLAVPDQFNKNARAVRGVASPAETGAWLIDYMCERIGIADLSECDVLDFGCGSRFAESFINRGIPIRSYLGIDLDRDMIDFLNANVDDHRLSFVWWNAQNPYYNPSGVPLDRHDFLPINGKKFDLICMFSVITHQLPQDAAAIFRLLRRSIRPGGCLFFSATIEEMNDEYKEMVTEVPAAHSAYSLDLLRRLTNEAGWKIVSVAPKTPPGPQGVVPIQDSLLCMPM